MSKPKPPPKRAPMTYWHGFAQDASTVRLLAQFDEIAATGAIDTELMKGTPGKRNWTAFNVDFRVVAVTMCAHPALHLVGVGLGGEVVIGTPQGTWEEQVDPSDEGPRRRGDLRTVQTIGDHVYAAGMGRQLYRRIGKDRWERADAGMVQELGLIQVSGLNALDGAAESDILAVGFLGEIWRRSKGRWSAIDSPTNLILHDVRVVPEIANICCGQEGVILRARGAGWDVIDHGGPATDLWATEYFGGQWFFAGEDGLYRLTNDDRLDAIDLSAHGEVGAFRHLHAGGGMLLAVATQAVLMTKDGATWTDISP